MASVLVVEDDPDLRVLYRTALSLAGYTVAAVEDGLDALRRIEKHGVPDVIVLDLGLPRLPGRDVYQELKARADTQHVPVVIVTGIDQRDINPNDYSCEILIKPIETSALVAAVDRCLEKVHDSRG